MTETNLRTLLVVEDEQLICRGIAHMLDWEKNGFKIIGEASNGREGLERVLELRPDIVLSDIRMPVMDGLEMIRRINAPDFPLHPDIIILSGYNDFELVREAFTLGVKDYLLKSKLSPEELLSVLSKTLSSGESKHFEPGERFKRLLLEDTEPVNRAKLVECGIKLHSNQLLAIIGKLEPQYHSIAPDEFLNGRFSWGSAYGFKLDDDVIFCIISASQSNIDMIVNGFSHKDNIGVEGFEKLFFHRLFFQDKDDLRSPFLRLRDFTRFLFYLPKGTAMESSQVSLCSRLPVFDSAHISQMAGALQFNELGEYLCSKMEELVHGLEFYSPDILKASLNDAYHISLFNATVNPKEMEKLAYLSISAKMKIDNAQSFDTLKDTIRAVFKESLSSIRNFRYQFHGKILSDIIEYMHGNYHKRLTLNDAAVRFHISKGYLCQLFKNKLDTTFNSYLMHIRIDAAKSLLLAEDTNIHEVSLMVGYSSQGYFAKHFKKLTGLTPSEFIKNNSTHI